MDEEERKGDLCVVEVNRVEREARDGRERERQRVEKRRRRFIGILEIAGYVSYTLPLPRLVLARIRMSSRHSTHILHPSVAWSAQTFRHLLQFKLGNICAMSRTGV